MPASQQQTERLAITATQPVIGSQAATPREQDAASVHAAQSADDPCTASRTQSEAQHEAVHQHAVQESAQEAVSAASLTQDSKQHLLQQYRVDQQKRREQTSNITPLAELPQYQDGQIVRAEVCDVLNLYGNPVGQELHYFCFL